MILTLLEKNLLLILVPVVSWYLANIISPMFGIKIKPFACAKCMGLWLGLAASLIAGLGLLSIPVAMVTSTLSIIFERWMQKL
jgi:hypothetical protein